MRQKDLASRKEIISIITGRMQAKLERDQAKKKAAEAKKVFSEETAYHPAIDAYLFFFCLPKYRILGLFMESLQLVNLQRTSYLVCNFNFFFYC